MRHWLGGIVKCSSCGASLMSTNHGTSYQCGNYNKGKCSHSHYIKTVELEKAVFSAFEKILDGSMELHYELKKRVYEDNINDKNMITKQLDKLTDKELRIKEAYQAGIDTIEEYKENKKLIQAEREALQQQLTILTEQSSSATTKSVMLKNISSVLGIIKDDSKDTLTRANAIRSVVDHCVYDKANDNLEIYFFLQR